MDGGMAAPPTAPEASTASPPTNGSGGGVRVENCYVFKSRLQEYAQKVGLPTPEYYVVKEGPSHEPVFKSTVVFNSTIYESMPGFLSRKAAEQSAAEVALMDIVKSMPNNANIQSVQETGLCKNLLQEYAQKMNYAIPSYICTKQASGLAPFICTVEIGGIQYIGAAARTKKEAEIKAARTALLAIQVQLEGSANGATKYIVVPGKRHVKETEKKPIETPKPLKAKKEGFKKKWNKRKFMKNNGQAVDMDKDDARVSGDVHDSDGLMQPAVIAQDISSDTTMHIPDEEVRIEQEPPKDIAMVQSNGETGLLKEKPSFDAAILQPDEEARRVEAETPRDTMMQPNEEALEAGSEKREPSIDNAILPPNEESRSAKQEPSIDTAMLPPNEDARSAKQEPPIDTGMLRPDEEARRVEPVALRDTANLQPNIEGRSVTQGPTNVTGMPQPDVEANGEVTSIKEGPASSPAIMQTVNQGPPSNALSLQPNEPKFENSESLYEHDNQSSGVASLEKNKAFGDMTVMDPAPSST